MEDIENSIQSNPQTDRQTDRQTDLAMASKHFLRWGWTAWGLRVCERISRSSSLERKKKRGKTSLLDSR